MNTYPKRVKSSGLKYWTQAKTKSIVVIVRSMVQENLFISSKKKIKNEKALWCIPVRPWEVAFEINENW